MKKAVKRVLKIMVLLLLAIVLCAAVLIGTLTVREYKPAGRETVQVANPQNKALRQGDTISLLTFNTGYCALDKDHDFFMDGGADVRPEAEDMIQKNMEGIGGILQNADADVVFLQEVDRDSKRSYQVDEAAYFGELMDMDSMAYATNFRCDYIPYPLPTIGKVEGGLVSFNPYTVAETTRIALPTSFTWPVRIGQLKRCLLVERVPVEGSDREVVFVNLHLEAYDDGSGKAAQTKVLYDFLQEEYEKGNYCIAGGDFNQTFDTVDTSLYPLIDTANFEPGKVDTSALGDGWTFAVDDTIPTSRLLNEPYDPESNRTQLYVIDGFITSPNVAVKQVRTLDEGFAYSDHNPVTLEVTLQ